MVTALHACALHIQGIELTLQMQAAKAASGMMQKRRWSNFFTFLCMGTALSGPSTSMLAFLCVDDMHAWTSMSSITISTMCRWKSNLFRSGSRAKHYTHAHIHTRM